MILYNIRANGPYEYDKFILNIYQIINDFVLLKQTEAKHKIYETYRAINDLYQKETDTSADTLQSLCLRNKGVTE
jgi:hypothetical protein